MNNKKFWVKKYIKDNILDFAITCTIVVIFCVIVSLILKSDKRVCIFIGIATIVIFNIKNLLTYIKNHK